LKEPTVIFCWARAVEAPDSVWEAVGKPVLVDVMVTVDEVPLARPVTLTSPELFMVTMPPFVAVPDHV